MPSSWSNNFNSNETKETSPQHSGWLDCFPRSVSRDAGMKCLNQAQQLFRKVPTSVPLQALASPGAVIFTIKPVARTCWDSRTSRTLPSGNPGLRHHWRPSWDDSARPLGRYQSKVLLSVGPEQHPNQRVHWSTRMSRMGVRGVGRDHTERPEVGRRGGEGHTAFH